MRFIRFLQARLRSERPAVALLTLVATCVFFYEYLPPFKTVHLWSDVSGYHYPLQVYAFQSLLDGRVPLWDPSVYCGITFVGNVQAALLYPPTWLMYAAASIFGVLPFKAFEVFVFLHVWAAFLLCYLWLRGRCGKLASALGAAVFACGGYMMCEVLHPGVLGAMTLMPLALWGVDESVERKDWRPLWKVTLASALAFLAGYPASWIVGCVLVGTYALASRRHWRAAAGVVVAVAASALLFAVQLAPALEARSYMKLQPKYGPGAYGLVDLLRSYFVGNWFDYNPGHSTDYDPGCLYLYVGLPAIFGIAWAIWRHRARPYIQPVLGMAVALLLANPPQFLIHAVMKIPALDYTMQPFNFYAAVAAMAALIAALGLNDFLERRTAGTLPDWVSYGAAGALAAWSLWKLWEWRGGGVFPTGPAAAVQTGIALALFSLCLWCVSRSTGRRRSAMAAILLFGAMADYQAYGSGRWFNAMKGDVDDEFLPDGIGGIDDTAYRAMRSNRQYRVVTVDSAFAEGALYRVWGLATTEGFDPFVSVQYTRAIEHWVPFQTMRTFHTDIFSEDMLRTLGVRYLLVRSGAADGPAIAANPNFKLVGRSDIFCRVYEYVNARPAYYWEEDNGGTARKVIWEPEVRELLVRSETGGRLVLVEQFYPGWRAVVDEQPALIERWDGAFQAVRLTAGVHRVRFEFRPRSVPIGAAVSLLALAGLLAVVRADSRSRAKAVGYHT